ncbi:PorT family protein [Pontibacter vulgaris]|uniref:PorT family protein n=1 Tax=Pontibacter vulgaris TaxID=2905679 RepID=UPI001FA6F8E0|nr:PorT family protein [Pontibacter vulgaris]
MLTDKEQEEIRRKLLGLEEEPPANGWNKIAAEIQPPRRPYRLWWVLIAALLLLVGSVGVLYFVKKPQTPVIATTVNSSEPNSESKSGETAATQKTGKVERSDQSIQQLKKSGSNFSEVAGKDPEVGTDKASEESQEAQPKNPEKQPVTGRIPVATLPNAEEPVKLPLPLIAEGKKPRNRYKSETGVTTKEIEITNKIAKTEKRESTEPTIASQPDKNKGTKAENAETDNTNSFELLKGRVTQLDSLHKLSVPDSVSIALVPDSAVKVVSIPTVDSVAKSREWYVGVTFAPRYTFRSFTPAATDDIYITNLNNYEKLDPKRMGYEFGLSAGKQLSKQLYLESSLNVMQLQENVSYAFTTGKVDTLLKSRGDDGSIRVIPVYVKGERQLESTFTYGGIRVGVNYYFLQSTRSRLNLTFAGGANLLLKGRTKEYINGELKETIDFPSEKDLFEQTNYNLLLGAGYNTSLGGNYELMLMPSLNYFLGSTFSKREPFGLKPYTLGLNIQVKRRFIK